MGIIIEEINLKNTKDVNKCDGEFIIDASIALSVENDEIRYKVVEMVQTKKRYQNDEIDYSIYILDLNKTIFLAYVDGQIAGQIILRRNWNNYAYIEDIVVDTKLRRQGIGKELIFHAKQWTRERNLAGIMLETQNNNVGACKFYERCGFRLEGFDRYLYKGVNRETDEIALYWYLFLDDTPSNPAHAIVGLPLME